MRKKSLILLLAIAIIFTTYPSSLYAESGTMSGTGESSPVESVGTSNGSTGTEAGLSNADTETSDIGAQPDSSTDESLNLGGVVDKPTPEPTVSAPTRLRRAVVSAALPQPLDVVYLDGEDGDDANSGESESSAVRTLAKALELLNTGGTLKVKNGFGIPNVVITKPVNVEVISSLTMTGSSTGTAIKLIDGSTLTVARGQTLTVSGYSKGIEVPSGAELNDGHYIIKDVDTGLDLKGNARGTSRENLVIEITARATKVGLSNSSSATYTKATLKWQGGNVNSWTYVPLNLQDSHVEIEKVWFYPNPLTMNDSYLKITGRYGAGFTGGHVMATYGATNNSVVTNSEIVIDGSRLNVQTGSKLTLDNSTLTIQNSPDGGINVNYGATLNIIDSTIKSINNVSEGFITKRFLGVGASDVANLYISGSSVIDTPATRSDQDVVGKDQGNYVITGGSYKLNSIVNSGNNYYIPTNGDSNGNDKLYYFTLKDSTTNLLKPINKNGERYDYPVARGNDDGKKRVWVPKAEVTFSLKNVNASFSDGTKDDKVQSTIRGYNLQTVEGNDNIENPVSTDKFLGWYYMDGETEREFSSDMEITEDLNVYAKWEGNKVTYNNGAGETVEQIVSVSEENPKPMSYEDAIKANPDFNREGMTFQGWSYDEAGDRMLGSDDTLSFQDGICNLYAQFKPTEYQIKFSANGGTFADDSVFKRHSEIFDIEKDRLNGEVAVLKPKATYGQTLSRVLAEAGSSVIVSDLYPSPDMVTRRGYTLGTAGWFSKYYPWRSEKGTHNFSYDDPNIRDNINFKLDWDVVEEDKVEVTDINLPADILTDYGSSAIRPIYPKDSFSITGVLDITPIQQHIGEIKGVFAPPVAASRVRRALEDTSGIMLTNVESNFNTTLNLPDGITVDKDATVTLDENPVFEINRTDISSDGRSIHISMTLKKVYTTFDELEEDILSLDSKLHIKVANISVKDELTPNSNISAIGIVSGEFNGVAYKEDSNKVFHFTWNGVQDSDGRDANEGASEAITYTFATPTNPYSGEEKLPGDIEVNGDTQHLSTYPVKSGETLDYTGKLDIRPIQGQIKALKDTYMNGSGESTSEESVLSNISLSRINSVFTASITFPEEMTIPENLSWNFSDNPLFEVKAGDVKVEGNTATIKMTLKKEYENFYQLYTDVMAVQPSLTFDLENIKVADNLSKGKLLTAIGNVEGSFQGAAYVGDGSASDRRDWYDFSWRSVQMADGKDSTAEAEDDTIRFTAEVVNADKLSDTLNGDILIGDNTESDKVFEAVAGNTYTYTGTLNVESIKKQIEGLRSVYIGRGEDPKNIKTKDIDSTFVAVYSFPDDISISDDSEVTLTGNPLFEIPENGIVKGANEIRVTMTLKKDYATFDDLYNDVISVPNVIKINLSGVRIKDDTPEGKLVTVFGTVNGSFTGIATVGGSHEAYDFSWKAVQSAEGKDAMQAPEDNETIRFTSKIKKVGEEKTDDDNPKKDAEKNNSGGTNTGDSNLPTLYIVIALLSALCIAGIKRYDSKKD